MTPLGYFWRHPRRTGFIIFNLVVLALFFAWGAFSADVSRDGLAGLPNLMLGYTGMALLIVAWIAAWIAWGLMAVARHRRLGH
jgi:hypothetical protein